MSLLYILLMFAAPALNPGASYVKADVSLQTMIPQFNVGYFTSLSILVFAVGGCEKISPYVNKMKDPAKGFPKGMIALAVMRARRALIPMCQTGATGPSRGLGNTIMWETCS